MLLIIYILIWLIAATAAGALYVTDNFNASVLMLFGFLTSALVFLGIIAVLPWWVNQPYSAKK